MLVVTLLEKGDIGESGGARQQQRAGQSRRGHLVSPEGYSRRAPREVVPPCAAPRLLVRRGRRQRAAAASRAERICHKVSEKRRLGKRRGKGNEAVLVHPFGLLTPHTTRRCCLSVRHVHMLANGGRCSSSEQSRAEQNLRRSHVSVKHHLSW